MKLLKELVEIRGASGDESRVRDFVINYIKQNQSNWKVKPELFHGDNFQDALIVVFGNPTTAIFAHMDSIGFTVGYGKNLIKIGGPRTIDGMQLVGSDSFGEIETELMVIEDHDGDKELQYVFNREIERGTILTFKPNFRETDDFIQSPYMDNRLGMWNALKVAESLENGAIVFSTYEEHGGNSVGFCGSFLFEKYAGSSIKLRGQRQRRVDMISRTHVLCRGCTCCKVDHFFTGSVRCGWLRGCSQVTFDCAKVTSSQYDRKLHSCFQTQLNS